MTTIAFKDGILAADSLITEGNERVGFITKIGRLECGVLYGAAGRLSTAQKFMAWVETGMDGDPPDFTDKDGDQNGKGFVIIDSEIIEFGAHGAVDKIPLVTSYSIGSGAAYARGAMEAGLSAEEAVKVACEIDVFSGGPVQTLQA